MIPLQCAQLCSDIYDKPELFDLIYDVGGVYVGLVRSANCDLFVFRGSCNFGDWVNDLNCESEWDFRLGFVHSGMFSGIPMFFEWAKTVVRSDLPASFIGHSLGGAHARLASGLFAFEGMRVSEVMTFGSPKPAGEHLMFIMLASDMVHTSYRNALDIVPTQPPDVFGYVHTEEWIQLNGKPPGGVECIEDHLIANYISALS